MKISDFEAELKALDERLDIVPNPHRPGLSNIKFMGTDVCPIPSDVIYDEPNPTYVYTFPNGMTARHKTRPEALNAVKGILSLTKSEDGMDQFLGRGKYV